MYKCSNVLPFIPALQYYNTQNNMCCIIQESFYWLYITSLALTSESSDGLGEMEYILIGIGGAILVGILILGFCIICVCCVRYRRRPKIYSPSKGLVIQIYTHAHTHVHTHTYTQTHTHIPVSSVCCVHYRRHPKSHSPSKGLVYSVHTCMQTHTCIHTQT